MIETLLVGGISGIITAIVISLVALFMHKRALERIQAAQLAWEHAQENRRQQWQTQQEQHILEFESKISTQIQRQHKQWQEWVAKDAERAESLKHQYELATTEAHIEYELARLPRVEDTPLTLDQHTTTTRGQSSRLQGADLSHRNLASRYLGYADLRGAQLVNANLFMADLFRAWLAGADLTNADLSATNLTETDLRGALLVGANFQVADLNNTVLIGADLRTARHLTLEQIQSAIYDDTTRFDEALAKRLSDAPSPQQRLTALPSMLPQETAQPPSDAIESAEQSEEPKETHQIQLATDATTDAEQFDQHKQAAQYSDTIQAEID